MLRDARVGLLEYLEYHQPGHSDQFDVRDSGVARLFQLVGHYVSLANTLYICAGVGM